MGRRKRRKVIRVVRKRLPTLFLCPNCGERGVKITVHKDRGCAVIVCGSCGLREVMLVEAPMEPVDIYCKFTDKFYSRE